MATRMLVSTADPTRVIRHVTNTALAAGYQELGLTGKAGGDATGLSTPVTYNFKINLDGAGSVNKSITTAGTVTFTAVISLLNAAMTGGLAGVVWSLTGGDVRCTSATTGLLSSIALAAGDTSDLFAAITGCALETAVQGTGPAEDPRKLAIIPSGGYSLPYPINVGGQTVVQVFADGSTVTGTPAVEGSSGSAGPWANIATVTNPTVNGTFVPVPFGTTAIRAIRINAGTCSGGTLHATLMCTYPNGSTMW